MPVDDEFDLFGILNALAKHKKKLVLVPLAAFMLAGGISFLIPNTYQSSTKLLPPQQAQSGAAALLSQLGGAASALGGAAGIKSPGELYMSMLRSRTVGEKLVARFKLKEVYDTDSMEKAVRKLAVNTVVSSGKDGIIIIAVEDEDRARAAAMANAYVDELLSLTKVLAVGEASQRRLFFERQLDASKNNLANAEMSLKGALETRGVISVDNDSQAVVATVSRLRAQVSAKEIELGAMRAFVTTNNHDYKRTSEELQSMRIELDRLENGRPADGKASPDKQAGLENIKLLREVKYHQMLYELLAKQYEVARLDEAKDAAMVQVLDPAIAAEKKIKPKRAIICIVSALLALFATMLAALLIERKATLLQRPENQARWERLRANLRG